MTATKIAAKIAALPRPRSAWAYGVRQYARDLCETLERWEQSNGWLPLNPQSLEKIMLAGATDWREYSYDGCAFCYDREIAERLCAPWEWRRTDGARLAPNSRETWLDVQARALCQAARLVLDAAAD